MRLDAGGSIIEKREDGNQAPHCWGIRQRIRPIMKGYSRDRGAADGHLATILRVSMYMCQGAFISGRGDRKSALFREIYYLHAAQNLGYRITRASDPDPALYDVLH